MRTVTVVCPVYNEEHVIASFYAELKTVLSGIDDRYEHRILFVVDRSQDATLDILKSIAGSDPTVMILALTARFGHQMSLLAGIDQCDSDAVIMMDCDLQHPPGLIPEMLDLFEAGHDIVYTVRQDHPGVNWLKQTTSKAFYRLINLVSDVPIHEGAADFRLISRRVATLFQTRLRERNMFFRGMMGWIGYKSAAIQFLVRQRPAGHSKYSLRRMLRFANDGVVSVSKIPLQAAIVLGSVFTVFGLGWALFILAQFVLSAFHPTGWTVFAALLAVVSGIQLIFLGVIGTYIGAVFDEVRARPHYIVDEWINIREGKVNAE